MGALSQRERIEARNFAVILILVPFTTYEKTRFTEQAGRIFTNSFSGLSRNGRLLNSYSQLSKAVLELVAGEAVLLRHGVYRAYT